MENRYLYRAKRIDSGEWVQGYYVKGSDMYGKETNVIFEPDAIFYSHGETDGLAEIDPSTICQCTGLKDKNAKLIWENDVVGFWDTYSTENGQAEMDCIGKVVWDDETISFQVTNRLSSDSYEVIDECSVIGNIFDNPELLDGKVNYD